MGKKSRREDDQFSMIPRRVMKSVAWRTLPHLARTVLAVFAVQYVGIANGTQCLSRAICREYGLEHSGALKAAKELEARGLIVLTYQAKYTRSHARVPNQWGLGWRDITHRGNAPLAHNISATNRWKDWRPNPKNDSGREARSDSNTAVQTTTEEIQNCGVPAQCPPDYCGAEAQPSENLGVPPPTAAWCVRPGSAVAHFFVGSGSERKAACGAVQRPDAYVSQSLRPRQAAKRHCTACLRALNGRSRGKEGEEAAEPLTEGSMTGAGDFSDASPEST